MLPKITTDVSRVRSEEWITREPTNPYLAAFSIGRQTNAVDWLLLRASLRRAPAALKSTERLLAQMIERLPTVVDDGRQDRKYLEREIVECVANWKCWKDSEVGCNWYDSLDALAFDGEKYDPSTWEGWPTQLIRQQLAEMFDSRYAGELRVALDLGRSVDRMVRPFSGPHALHLLARPKVPVRRTPLDTLALAYVRRAAKKLRIDLPANIENRQFSAAAEGADVVDRHLSAELAALYQKHLTVRGKKAQRPHFDAGSRRLYLGSKVIKRFRSNATNQICILTAFEECDWPRRIDDPLSPTTRIDPTKARVREQRLKEAIKSLNLNLCLLRFHGDGNGCGVTWTCSA